MARIRIQALPSRNTSIASASASASTSTPSHWVGNPPTHFQNPWPSFNKHNFVDILHTRFGPNRNFVPVPTTRDELVKVRTPDWGRGQPGWETGLKATWLGHAGFLVETAAVTAENANGHPAARGIRILFDAVFSDRTSPVGFLGPKRYTPTPCHISELPQVDLVVISHNHYDHLDIATIKYVYEKQKAAGQPIHFFAALGNKAWFLNAGFGIQDDEVTECDWWHEQDVHVEALGSVRLVCTPAQHLSGRTPFDAGKTLWCSWIVEDSTTAKRLFFAGDTAYKAVSAPTPCPVFAEIGKLYGPFDLAMLPIGLYSPQEFMSSLHCEPRDSLNIHKAIRSKKSVGMHFGTFRGGLSQHYEDVREPPRAWRECCEKEGLWGSECGLLDVGETAIV